MWSRSKPGMLHLAGGLNDALHSSRRHCPEWQNVELKRASIDWKDRYIKMKRLTKVARNAKKQKAKAWKNKCIRSCSWCGWLVLSLQCVLSHCARLPLSKHRILEMEGPRWADEIVKRAWTAAHRIPLFNYYCQTLHICGVRRVLQKWHTGECRAALVLQIEILTLSDHCDHKV